jgi:hypothetical protein
MMLLFHQKFVIGNRNDKFNLIKKSRFADLQTAFFIQRLSVDDITLLVEFTCDIILSVLLLMSNQIN